MIATRDQLRSIPALKLTKDNCRLTFRGKPKPTAARTFVGIWYGYWRDYKSNGESLDTLHGINITVSMRTTQVAEDQIDDEVVVAEEGLLIYCERIVAALHMDPINLSEGGLFYSAVMKRANDLINDKVPGNGFVEPLQFEDGGSPEPKGGDWWGAKGEPFAGVAQTIRLGKARRVQAIPTQT